MYIIQNALKNIMRNRGRNILLAAIIFSVIATSVVALIISNTSDGVINDYKSRFGTEVMFQTNREKIVPEADGRRTRPQIEPDKLITFGESDYLLEAIFHATAKVKSTSLKAIDADKGGGTMSYGSNTEDAVFSHKLINIFDEFSNGYRSLTAGSRMPENDNECIISQELLENSGLSIGDMITLTSALSNNQNAGDVELMWELIVVGTFYDLTEEYAEQYQFTVNNRRNEILTNLNTIASKMLPGYNEGIRVDARYYLKSPDLLDAFADEVYAKGLSAVFDVTTDDTSYNAVIKPVESLKGISMTFLAIVLILGALIIILLASISIRERKYEIGVLRAMGMKKPKVALGLWTETVAVTLICLIAGLGIGAVIAQPIANVLLEQQASAAEAGNMNNTYLVLDSFRNPASTDTKPLKNIDVSLGSDTMLEIIVISLLIASVSGIAAISKITKYEPIKILMERN
jgi:putative ABC transport system permease protein